MIDSKSALEAIRTTDWRRGEATTEKAHPEIRKAQRVSHSVRTLAPELAGVLPAEHMHFMIDTAKAVDMLFDSAVAPLVTQSEQALHRAITELEFIAGGLESGKWAHVKRGCQRHHHLRQAGQVDEGSRTPPVFARFFWPGACGEQMARTTDVVAKASSHFSAQRSHAVPKGGLCRDRVLQRR